MNKNTLVLFLPIDTKQIKSDLDHLSINVCISLQFILRQIAIVNF